VPTIPCPASKLIPPPEDPVPPNIDRLPPTLSAERAVVDPAAIVTGAASTDELSPTDNIIDPAISDPLVPDRILIVPVEETDDAPLLKVKEPDPS